MEGRLDGIPEAFLLHRLNRRVVLRMDSVCFQEFEIFRSGDGLGGFVADAFVGLKEG